MSTGNSVGFLNTGSKIRFEGEEYQIEHLLGVNAVLAINLNDGSYKQIRFDTSSVHETLEKMCEINNRDLNDYSEEDWKIAQDRLAIIAPLLKNDYRTKADVESVANANNLSVPTLYKWISAYQREHHISALVPSQRGVKSGSKRIDSRLEIILEETIDEFYLSKQRVSPVDVIEEVFVRCKVAGLKAPHENTIRNRIKAIPQKKALKARGQKDKARDGYDPIRGHFPGADYPLSVVQIDHTEADIMLVDDIYRRPIGRPWLTLAIDVCTRIVTGYFISPEAPSALSTGMCTSRSILPKNELLAQLNIPGSWPVWGKMRVLHADNGKDFRGKMLKNACAEHNIDLQLRPVKVPHYGGHIERLMGTASAELRKIPGKTFSNIQQRKGYDSEKEAVMTFDEFEAHIIDFIVNKYHCRKHSELNMPPIKMWELRIQGDGSAPGVGIPLVPDNQEKIQLDFMPFFERSVQRYGIQIDHVYYYHESLSHWINSMDPNDNKRKRKFVVRRDPRNISQIYFFDPGLKHYFTIPYRDMSHPAASIWELKDARKRLLELGRDATDEQALFETIMRLRERIFESVEKTKSARKKSKRISITDKLESQKATQPEKQAAIHSTAQLATKCEPVDELEDLFSEPVNAFDDLDVKL